jgi:hypothetical protein
MDIFNQQKPEVDLKKEQETLFDEALNTSLNSVKASVNMLIRGFFDNPAITAQERCDLKGTKAVEYFNIIQTTIQYIKTLDPSWEAPQIPYEITVNEDGTVLIGDKIEE